MIFSLSRQDGPPEQAVELCAGRHQAPRQVPGGRAGTGRALLGRAAERHAEPQGPAGTLLFLLFNKF